MSGPSRPVSLYIAAVSAASVAAAAATATLDREDRVLGVWPLLLPALIAIGRRFPLPLPGQSKGGNKQALSTVPILMALFLFSPPRALLVAVIGVAAANIALKRRWYNTMFNCAATALAIAVAVSVMETLSYFEQKLFDIPLMALGALVYYLVNTALVAGVSGVQRGTSPLRVWVHGRKFDWASELALSIIAIGVALVAPRYPLVVVGAVAGTAAIYYLLYMQVNERKRWQTTVEDLAASVDDRTVYTEGQSLRVATLGAEVARALSQPVSVVEAVRQAGKVMNVGTLNLSEDVLLRDDVDSDDAPAALRNHPLVGAKILQKLPEYALCWEFVRGQLERWDGNGFPDGLGHEELPLGTRILSVVNAYVRLTSPRPFRAAMSPTQALMKMVSDAGTRYDPKVIDALAVCLEPTDLEIHRSRLRTIAGATQ
jgi:hypothetical protein